MKNTLEGFFLAIILDSTENSKKLPAERKYQNVAKPLVEELTPQAFAVSLLCARHDAGEIEVNRHCPGLGGRHNSARMSDCK